MTKRFYKSCLGYIVELVYPETELESRGKKVKELENDKELYGEFLQWANSSENIEKKKQLYINDLWLFRQVPEGGRQRGSRKFLNRKNSFLQRLVLIEIEIPQLCKTVHFSRFLLF